MQISYQCGQTKEGVVDIIQDRVLTLFVSSSCSIYAIPSAGGFMAE